MKRMTAQQVELVRSNLARLERYLFEAKSAVSRLAGDDAENAAESIGVAMGEVEERAQGIAAFVAPFWIVEFEQQARELVKQALDLDSWEESKGVTSLDHIVCPHCHGTQRGGRSMSGGTRLCETCAKEFFYHRVPTPRGRAWQTWDKDPRTPAKGA